MRVTIELKDRHRYFLHTPAAKKGIRGYSAIIEEALDTYIEQLSKKDSTKDEILKMMGSWQMWEVSKVKMKIKEMRKNWTPL